MTRLWALNRPFHFSDPDVSWKLCQEQFLYLVHTPYILPLPTHRIVPSLTLLQGGGRTGIFHMTSVSIFHGSPAPPPPPSCHIWYVSITCMSSIKHQTMNIFPMDPLWCTASLSNLWLYFYFCVHLYRICLHTNNKSMPILIAYNSSEQNGTRGRHHPQPNMPVASPTSMSASCFTFITWPAWGPLKNAHVDGQLG